MDQQEQVVAATETTTPSEQTAVAAVTAQLAAMEKTATDGDNGQQTPSGDAIQAAAKKPAAPMTDAFPAAEIEAAGEAKQKVGPDGKPIVPGPEEKKPQVQDGDGVTLAPELVAMAKEYGLTDAEAQAFGTPAALTAALGVFDRKIAALGREQLAAGAPPPPTPPPLPTTVPSVDPRTATPAPAATPGVGYKSKLSRDTYESDLVDEIEATGTELQQVKSQLAVVLQHLGQQVGEQARRQIASEDQQFDGAISTLPEGYKEVLGVGTAAEMDRTTEQFKNRCELYQQMQAIRAGMKAMGQAPPPQKVLFERALRSLFGGQERTIARRQVSESLQRDAAGRFIQRPAGRRTDGDSSLTPVDRAVKAVAVKLAEFGATP